MARGQLNVYKINTNTNTTINSNNNTDTDKKVYSSEEDLPKIIKTLTFLAFLQGYEKNEFRAWTRSSTETCPYVDTGLIPSLTKHMSEFAKNLGEVLPKNPFKRGIQVLDKADAQILAGEQLLAVRVDLHFIKLYKELTSENIAYAIKNINPNFNPDRYLIALQTSGESIPSPCKESTYFEGTYSDEIWNVYVKKGECRHYYKKTDKTDQNGNPIYEDSGLLEFPEKSAWEFLDERKHKVSGNTKMVEFLKGLYSKDDIPQPKETPVVIKEPAKTTINVKKDQLGSIGDNVKIQKKVR